MGKLFRKTQDYSTASNYDIIWECTRSIYLFCLSQFHVILPYLFANEVKQTEQT